MNTRQIAKEYRLQHWSNIISERVDSGLSIRAYCKDAKIHENSYYYWQKKIRTAAIEGLSASRSEQPHELTQLLTKVNLPLDTGFDNTDASRQDFINIDVPGMRLTAGSGYPIDNLTKLLRVVSRL
jgi:hypothetical protein